MTAKGPESVENPPVDASEGALPDDERGLWVAWKEQGDADARTSLILRYLPSARAMARSVLRTVNPSYLDIADLTQLATVGLMESMDRFDHGFGVSFIAYASKRMRGAVLNGLESQSELHAQSAFRRRIRQERLQSLRSDDKERSGEIFAEMVELALGLAVGLMLEGTTLFQEPEDGTTKRISYGDSGALLVRSQTMRDRVAALQGNERTVLELHYFNGVQFAEIAQMLKLTKGRISQIHARAIKRLREDSRNHQPMDLKI